MRMKQSKKCQKTCTLKAPKRWFWTWFRASLASVLPAEKEGVAETTFLSISKYIQAWVTAIYSLLPFLSHSTGPSLNPTVAIHLGGDTVNSPVRRSGFLTAQSAPWHLISDLPENNKHPASFPYLFLGTIIVCYLTSPKPFDAASHSDLSGTRAQTATLLFDNSHLHLSGAQAS